jgi:hypothetical protein
LERITGFLDTVLSRGCKHSHSSATLSVLFMQFELSKEEELGLEFWRAIVRAGT